MSVANNTNDALKNRQLTAHSVKITRQNSKEAKEISELRSFLVSLLDLSYPQAYESILQFLSRRYSFSSMAWLERKGNQLEAVFASGKLQSQQELLSISADDKRLLDAVKREVSLELRERRSAGMVRAPKIINFFPISVSGEIRSALIVADKISSDQKRRYITHFCQAVAPELEILRLREEISRRNWLERAVQKFNKGVKDIDAPDFWSSLVQVCTELMRAERGSLLAFDEKSNRLLAKAAVGACADVLKREKEKLGERIAQKVLQTGNPLIVKDVRRTAIPAAPGEWKYKTNSFISYPIIVGHRKIGVLNFSDRAGGESFNKLDLEILNAINPQMALLTESAMLRHKAGKFEQLSITDALTGLLNRLYLDERLPEEVRRSNRESFPMSFLMIDVDKFKSYNDEFGHTEGDKALKIVAHCLKSTLRGADVAVRYGGEEFSILLPQTTTDGAVAIAERIREKVATTKFPNRQVTISIGVASCFNDACTEHEIIRWADNALYEAKRRGRNNVQVYEHFDAEPAEDAELTDEETLQIESLVFSEEEFAGVSL